jgi:hypothetical protein
MTESTLMAEMVIRPRVRSNDYWSPQLFAQFNLGHSGYRHWFGPWGYLDISGENATIFFAERRQGAVLRRLRYSG